MSVLPYCSDLMPPHFARGRSHRSSRSASSNCCTLRICRAPLILAGLWAIGPLCSGEALSMLDALD
jgi:hypothetical protein